MNKLTIPITTAIITPTNTVKGFLTLNFGIYYLIIDKQLIITMTLDKQLYGLRILRTGFVICFQSFDTKVIFAKRLKYFNTANPKINITGLGVCQAQSVETPNLSVLRALLQEIIK